MLCKPQWTDLNGEAERPRWRENDVAYPNMGTARHLWLSHPGCKSVQFLFWGTHNVCFAIQRHIPEQVRAKVSEKKK
jgi:hypothetical protein